MASITSIPRTERDKAYEATDWRTALKKRRERGREESKAELRKQAQDFVVWLKREKAIP